MPREFMAPSTHSARYAWNDRGPTGTVISRKQEKRGKGAETTLLRGFGKVWKKRGKHAETVEKFGKSQKKVWKMQKSECNLRISADFSHIKADVAHSLADADAVIIP